MQQLISPLDKNNSEDRKVYVYTGSDGTRVNSQHGFFPINDIGFWHGGVHLEGNLPVRAIADGELVAYRLNDTTKEGKLNGKDIKYSNEFVLLRHRFETPKKNPIEFYSLYMHLLPLHELDQSKVKKLPPVFKEYVYTVATDEDGAGLAIHDPETGIKTCIIPRHALVEVLEDKPYSFGWMGREEYWLVLYDGLFEGYARIPGNARKLEERIYQITTNRDQPFNKGIDAGINVRDGKEKDDPVLYVLPKGARVIFDDKKSETKSTALANGQRHKLKGGGYIYKSEKTINCKLMVDPEVKFNEVIVPDTPIPVSQGQILGYPGTYCGRGPMIHFEIFAGDDNLMTSLKEFLSLNPEGPDFLANKTADKFGLKILKLKQGAVLFERTETTEKVDGKKEKVIKYDKAVGSTTKPVLAYELCAPDVVDGKVYRQVMFDMKVKKAGWISENDTNVEAVFSPYDWSKIWETLQDDSFSDDGFCDVAKLFKALDKDGDKRIDADEVKAAVSDPETYHWLKHLICVHPTEWDAGKNGSKWQRLKKEPWNFTGEHAAYYDQAVEHVEQMQWWSDAKAKLPGLPDPNKVYHFHPIGFLEHFNRLAVPFTMDDAWHIIDVVAKAESGQIRIRMLQLMTTENLQEKFKCLTLV